MARTLGIDFGYAPETPSLGYIQFDTHVSKTETVISLVAQSEISTLQDFKTSALARAYGAGVSLIALDAPITPSRLAMRPRSGRMVEKRFSRGDFSNVKRGPQPSSISVPRQGWPLYCGAMEMMVDLGRLGYKMPLITDGALTLSGNDVVEVCPKMTQSLLVPQSRVMGRPGKQQTPAFYRKIDNWLFSHLFVPEAPLGIDPPGQQQPSWGIDHTGLLGLIENGVRIDQSVWSEAARIASSRPLTRRHELIGAFVAGIQGAIALAGSSVAVGAGGDHEGYYVLPSQWHVDWTHVWEKTRKNGDVVSSFPVISAKPKSPEPDCGE